MKAPFLACIVGVTLNPALAQQLLYEIPADGHLAPIADLDNDGVDDLRVGFSVYSGSNGSFIVQTSAPDPGDPYEATGTPVEDITGDGYPDIVFLLEDNITLMPPIRVHSGATGAFFASATPAAYLPTVDTIEWVDGDHDVNGDGAQDIVFGTTKFGFGSALYGYMSGAHFTLGQDNDQGEDLFSNTAAAHSAVFSDLDNDGVEDALFQMLEKLGGGSGFYQAWSFPGLGASTLLWSNSLSDTVTDVVDLDGDGTPDLLTVLDALLPPPGPLAVLSGADRQPLLSIPGSFTSAWSVGDIDCDGVPDFLAASGVATIYSGADASVLWQVPFDVDGFARLDDLNGDGLGDWAMSSTSLGKTQVWVSPGPDTPSYCTGKVNSSGCVPTIDSTGTPTATGPDDFLVTARDTLAGKPGLFFWGTTGPAALPFLGGRCACLRPYSVAPSFSPRV